jgi:hypothetical protein
LVVCAVGVGSLFHLLALLGQQDFARTVSMWREATAGAIFVFSPSRMASSLKFVASPEATGFLTVSGLVYGLHLARHRGRQGLCRALPLAFAVLGLVWYAFGSIGWPRYAFPMLAIATIFAARLLRDLVTAEWGETAAGMGKARAMALLVGLVFIVGYPLLIQLRDLAAASDRSPQATAAYLEATVPASSVIETWEPELGFLSDRVFHYPPSGWLDRAVRARWLEGNRPLESYDPSLEANPSYLVVGPFAKFTGIYARLLSSRGNRMLTSIGEYDIYLLD